MQILTLFKKAFVYYDNWPELKKKATGEGSYHSSRESEKFKALIDSYDITIPEFRRRIRGGIL